MVATHDRERHIHQLSVPDRNFGHALRVLRTIHANPRAAGMIQGYAYAYSNYRSPVERNKRSALRHLMDGFSQTDWFGDCLEAAQ